MLKAWNPENRSKLETNKAESQGAKKASNPDCSRKYEISKGSYFVREFHSSVEAVRHLNN